MAHEILELVCLVRANQTWITQYIPWKLDSPRGDQFPTEFSRFCKKTLQITLILWAQCPNGGQGRRKISSSPCGLTKFVHTDRVALLRKYFFKYLRFRTKWIIYDGEKQTNNTNNRTICKKTHGKHYRKVSRDPSQLRDILSKLLSWNNYVLSINSWQTILWEYCDIKWCIRELKTELTAVSYTHLRAHETRSNLVCRLLL